MYRFLPNQVCGGDRRWCDGGSIIPKEYTFLELRVQNGHFLTLPNICHIGVIPDAKVQSQIGKHQTGQNW